MGLRRDKVVVVDIEATCWRENTPPPGQINEIIEVGVCVLDLDTLTPTDKRSILVRPTRSVVSAFCTELTTLTQKQVDGGTTFEAACAALQADYDTRNRLWISWGQYDRRMFEKQCASFGVDYPFSPAHVNIKALEGKLNRRGRQVGMVRALAAAGIEQEGTHHRGDDDAWNIAKLTAWVLREHGVSVFERFWNG